VAKLNVHRVIDDVLALVAHDRLASGIEFQRHFDPSIPEIEADAGRLRQVVLNLVRNALQAMEGGGRLAVSTRMTLDHRLRGAAGDPVATVAIEVRDSGPGIPPRDALLHHAAGRDGPRSRRLEALGGAPRRLAPARQRARRRDARARGAAAAAA
jgi:nitrogen-specific signal transduction histidine kinase